MRMIDVYKLVKDVESSLENNPHLGKVARNAHRSEHLHFLYLISKQPVVNQWVPVADHNPDVNKPVFVTFREEYFDKKYRYGTCKAIWIPAHTVTDEEMGWAEEDFEDVTEYDESEDKYYIKEGWWEVIENWPDYTEVYISGEVIAWQPLPEPYRDSEVEK